MTGMVPTRRAGVAPHLCRGPGSEQDPRLCACAPSSRARARRRLSVADSAGEPAAERERVCFFGGGVRRQGAAGYRHRWLHPGTPASSTGGARATMNLAAVFGGGSAIKLAPLLARSLPTASDDVGVGLVACPRRSFPRSWWPPSAPRWRRWRRRPSSCTWWTPPAPGELFSGNSSRVSRSVDCVVLMV